jgi:hypothetical protein
MPSDQPKPSTDASNVWQVLVGDMVPRLDAPVKFSTSRSMLVPPTTAAVQSPRSKLWQAQWSAYKDVLHAVTNHHFQTLLKDIVTCQKM